MVGIEAVEVDALCPPPEPYTYAIRAADRLYLAGQVSLEADANVIGETVTEQAHQVWQNIADVIEAPGSSIADVVEVTYYMQDIRRDPR